MTQGAPEELSARELEILEAVVTGATNQQIAQTLHISINTVKAHLRNIFAKLGVESRTEATSCAIRRGLVRVAAQEAGATQALQSAGTPVAPKAGATPALQELPAPQTLAIPLRPIQRILVVFSLLLVLAVTFWPTTQASPTTSNNPLIDLPQSSLTDGTPTAALRWQTKASLPTARGRFASVQVDGTLLVIGGLTEDGWSARVDAYNAASDSWDRRTDKPTAVANVGAALMNGRVYVPGGNDADNRVLTVVEVYDPASDTWSTVAPLPTPLCAYAIAATESGLYLFGGWDGTQYVSTTYYYDATNDAWETRTPLPFARGFAAAATVGERIYVVGGQDAESEYAMCTSYTPALDVAGSSPWQTYTPMNAKRAGHGMVVVEGALYVVGGSWGSYVTYNERYDPVSDAWSKFESPLPGEWRSLGLAAVSNAEGIYLYALGGWDGSYLSAVRTYQVTFRAYIPVQ